MLKSDYMYEIYDEHDAIMSQEVTQLQNGSYRVMGNVSLAKVFDFFEIPDDDIKANTINGWVMICLDRLPARGDTFTYETGNVKLDVRVTKVASRKALEIVHFGTTHNDTRALTMDALRTKVEKRFASLEVYEAYTSRIVVKRLKTRGIAKRTPLEMLLKLCAEGYTRVLVQSTNIISGLENESLRREVERVRPFFKEVRLGNPLLYEVYSDRKSVV